VLYLVIKQVAIVLKLSTAISRGYIGAQNGPLDDKLVRGCNYIGELSNESL